MRKYCPDLTQKQWNQAMLRGQGDYQIINLNECIGEMCAAYDMESGICRKFNIKAVFDDEVLDEKTPFRKKGVKVDRL